MFLKIMSNEDMPDGNNSKCCEIIECREVRFVRGEGKARADFVFGNDRDDSRVLEGNAYILNDNGRTVDSFAVDRWDDPSR